MAARGPFTPSKDGERLRSPIGVGEQLRLPKRVEQAQAFAPGQAIATTLSALPTCPRLVWPAAPWPDPVACRLHSAPAGHGSEGHQDHVADRRGARPAVADLALATRREPRALMTPVRPYCATLCREPQVRLTVRLDVEGSGMSETRHASGASSSAGVARPRVTSSSSTAHRQGQGGGVIEVARLEAVGISASCALRASAAEKAVDGGPTAANTKGPALRLPPTPGLGPAALLGRGPLRRGGRLLDPHDRGWLGKKVLPAHHHLPRHPAVGSQDVGRFGEL